MISLKFPPLQKLVQKEVEELHERDPRRGITVLSEHAIIITDRSLLFFNMKDYFVKTNAIKDEDIMNSLDIVMEFMHGKMFTVPFWEELTKGAVMSVEDETLQLDGRIRKDLFYKERSFDEEDIVAALRANISNDPVSVPRASIYIAPIFDILNVLKSITKNDSIALEYVGVNTMIRFTFKDNPWLFGLISSDPMLNSQNFLFSNMGMLLTEIS